MITELQEQQDVAVGPDRSRKSVTPVATTGCGNVYLTASEFGVFIQLGKAGGCAAAHLSAVAKLITMVERLGGTKAEIAAELSGTQCPRPPACIDCIADMLKEIA